MRIRGRVTPGRTITATLGQGRTITAKFTAASRAPAYQGEYAVTPSNVRQELDTAGKTLERAVVVEPIPNNYGLITWDGSTLMVS